MESNQLNSPKAFSHKGQDKGTHFRAQMKKVFAAFYGQPKTMLMVSVETGILRANICRYVAEWEKENRIYMVRKGICPISKHRAGFYTTSPNLFPAIDWSTARTGFAPTELNNTGLEVLKTKNRSWLHKKLVLLFAELFDNHPPTVEFVYCSPTDIKKIWFKNNSRIETNHIRRVLRHEMKLDQVGKVIRYQPLELYTTPQGGIVNSKTTTPFIVPRTQF